MVTAREKMEDSGVYDLNLATGKQGNGGGKGQNGSYSYIMRLNYNYAEKYLIELIGRRDGNSKFAKGHKFKNFVSASAGWVFTSEEFLKRSLRWSILVNFVLAMEIRVMMQDWGISII